MVSLSKFDKNSDISGRVRIVAIVSGDIEANKDGKFDGSVDAGVDFDSDR